MTEQEAFFELKSEATRLTRCIETARLAVYALEEIQQYREIGTVEEVRDMKSELARWHTDRPNDRIKNEFARMSTLVCHNCDHKDEYIEELEAEMGEYRAIGTVEECREAREKQKAVKPDEISPCRSVSFYKCPVCGEVLIIDKGFCCNCGQALDWSGDEETAVKAKGGCDERSRGEHEEYR